MIVYRIGPSKFIKDLTGEGARLHGGRWNHKLTACLYTAESRSLAVLEYSVNVMVDDIPRALSFLVLDVPNIFMRIVEEAEMPGDWRTAPAPPSTKDFGTSLLTTNNFLSIKIPSTVIPQEFCYLLNPAHAAMKNVKILGVEDCVYDLRIKTV